MKNEFKINIFYGYLFNFDIIISSEELEKEIMEPIRLEFFNLDFELNDIIEDYLM